jgi:hypothetical protein
MPPVPGSLGPDESEKRALSKSMEAPGDGRPLAMPRLALLIAEFNPRGRMIARLWFCTDSAVDIRF